jgi:poly-gamma-glutamate synthesis protein (capsule biosynthesis protein)
MNLTEARRPEILEVKGQRIAYFGYYTGEDHQATETTAGTNPALEARIAEDIQAIRDRVDWIIVNFHWGVELSNYPETWQSKLAHFAIDRGADVVVGHHPHVLQGSEIYRGRPIAYSLGNFIFGGNARSDYDTAVLKVSVREKQMKVEFLPVEVRKYQPKIVQGERGDRIMAEIAMFSNIFEQAMTSPMILDAKSSEVIADPENSVFASNPTGNGENIPGATGNNSTIAKTPDGESITFPLKTNDETGTFEQSAFTSADDGLEIAIPPEPEPGQTSATSDPALISPEPESSNYLTFATGTAVAIAVAAGAAIATNKKTGGRKPTQLPLLPNLRG